MNQNEVNTLLDSGSGSIAMFLSGPTYWQVHPVVEIRPDLIFNYQMLALNMPTVVTSSFIDGQRALAHLLIDQLADAMTQWAKDHDRPDLLATVAERLEKAVLASDEP